jgi:hypothetical protein
MVLLFKLLGWATVAFGFLLFLVAGQQLRSDELGACLVASLSGIGACYWGYLLARPVDCDSDEWDDDDPDDEEDWGW